METIDTMQAVFRRLSEMAVNPSYDAAVRASAGAMSCALRERFACLMSSDVIGGLVRVPAAPASIAFDARP